MRDLHSDLLDEIKKGNTINKILDYNTKNVW
jgi:hypothetical protein